MNDEIKNKFLLFTAVAFGALFYWGFFVFVIIASIEAYLLHGYLEYLGAVVVSCVFILAPVGGVFLLKLWLSRNDKRGS